MQPGEAKPFPLQQLSRPVARSRPGWWAHCIGPLSHSQNDLLHPIRVHFFVSYSARTSTIPPSNGGNLLHNSKKSLPCKAHILLQICDQNLALLVCPPRIRYGTLFQNKAKLRSDGKNTAICCQISSQNNLKSISKSSSQNHIAPLPTGICSVLERCDSPPQHRL